MDRGEKEELRQVWNDLLDAFGSIKMILREKLSEGDYERVRAYGIGHVEAGLGEGNTMPCMCPINTFIENLLDEEDDPEEDDEQVCSIVAMTTLERAAWVKTLKVGDYIFSNCVGLAPIDLISPEGSFYVGHMWFSKFGVHDQATLLEPLNVKQQRKIDREKLLAEVLRLLDPLEDAHGTSLEKLQEIKAFLTGDTNSLIYHGPIG